MEDILGLSPGVLKDSDTRESIPSWTSLADVNILTTISSELGIEPEAALLEATTFGEMIQWLDSQGAFDA